MLGQFTLQDRVAYIAATVEINSLQENELIVFQNMCIVEPVTFPFGNPGNRLAQPHSRCEQHSCGGTSSRDSMSCLLLHITRTVLSKNRNDLLSVVIFTLYQHLTAVSMYSMHLS